MTIQCQTSAVTVIALWLSLCLDVVSRWAWPVTPQTLSALKGGTAINLFVRDMPHVSVDIDLVYLPLEDRNTSLENIRKALGRIAGSIEKNLQNVKVTSVFESKPDALRLIVARDKVRIKIELSPVLRGTVYDPERREVTEKVESLAITQLQALGWDCMHGAELSPDFSGWREHYNNVRPHSSLAYVPPVVFAERAA